MDEIFCDSVVAIMANQNFRKFVATNSKIHIVFDMSDKCKIQKLLMESTIIKVMKNRHRITRIFAAYSIKCNNCIDIEEYINARSDNEIYPYRSYTDKPFNVDKYIEENNYSLQLYSCFMKYKEIKPGRIFHFSRVRYKFHIYLTFVNLTLIKLGPTIIRNVIDALPKEYNIHEFFPYLLHMILSNLLKYDNNTSILKIA